MQKAVAGIVIGMAAAAMILGLDGLFNALSGGSGIHPLQTIELKTYDWRLSRTAQPSTARADLALVEIDEYSLRNLQPNAGRWPCDSLRGAVQSPTSPAKVSLDKADARHAAHLAIHSERASSSRAAVRASHNRTDS